MIDKTDLARLSMVTPLGALTIIGNDEALLGVHFQLAPSLQDVPRRDDCKPLIDAHEQLQAYFNGELHTFDLPLALSGSDFELQVWKELTKIPYATTISYQQQANNIRNPKAVRAVAGANGRNNFSIIIPCHRVINSDGKLGGYSSGIDKKAALLNHERIFSKKH